MKSFPWQSLAHPLLQQVATPSPHESQFVAVFHLSLMELMQDVQQYGQPPAEIIKELAPGLEFNAEGMPVMPGLGATMTPSDLPGMPGIPFPETTPDGQPCSVM